MPNKYDAFTGLAAVVASSAHFLDATAKRATAGELSQAEYANRLTDTATILRDGYTKAAETFFTPD